MPGHYNVSYASNRRPSFQREQRERGEFERSRAMEIDIAAGKQEDIMEMFGIQQAERERASRAQEAGYTAGLESREEMFGEQLAETKRAGLARETAFTEERESRVEMFGRELAERTRASKAQLGIQTGRLDIERGRFTEWQETEDLRQRRMEQEFDIYEQYFKELGPAFKDMFKFT